MSSNDRPFFGDTKYRIVTWVRKASKAARYEWMSEMLAASLAQQIKGLRLKHGMTQKQLAEGLGTKAPMISLWESGTYQGYSIKSLQRIAEFFDCALIIRLVGWPEFIAFTADGPVLIPASYKEEKLRP